MPDKQAGDRQRCCECGPHHGARRPSSNASPLLSHYRPIIIALATDPPVFSTPLAGNGGTVAICVTFREKSRVSMRGCTALSGTLWKDRSKPPYWHCHVWTAPADQGLFCGVAFDRGCGHVFGLLMRVMTPVGPDVVCLVSIHFPKFCETG
jgi:hypothetical protein